MINYLTGGQNQCKEVRVRMTIRGPEDWKNEYGSKGSPEFKTLETKLTSEVSCN